MKHQLIKRLCVVILSSSMLISTAAPALCAMAYISKPPAKSRNAAEYYKGSNTFYGTDSQQWIKLKSSLLYTYQAKKNARYYRPMFYLTSSWLSNNRQNITVHLGKTHSKSVSKVVSSTLGVSSPNTSLASSISSSYSSTISHSYSTDYTFVMKNYSTLYYYRPALFGYIMKYGIVKRHKLLKRASVIRL